MYSLEHVTVAPLVLLSPHENFVTTVHSFCEVYIPFLAFLATQVFEKRENFESLYVLTQLLQ